MLEMMGHSMCSITDLKSNPNQIFERAGTDGGVYVLKRQQPVAVVVSVPDYEALLKFKQEHTGRDDNG